MEDFRPSYVLQSCSYAGKKIMTLTDEICQEILRGLISVAGF